MATSSPAVPAERRPRRLAGLAALLWAGGVGCADWRGQEVVEGFHGYGWGTPATAIAELAGSDPVGEREGLAMHTADAVYLGRKGAAVFYFHPRTGGLVEGAYALAVSLEECGAEWARYAEHLEAAYPALIKEERIPSPPEAVRARYDSVCEYFVFNSEDEEWTATLVNPERPHDRAGVRLTVVGRSPRIHVYFRGGAGQAWEDGPKRLPRDRSGPLQLFRPAPPAPSAPPAPPAPIPQPPGEELQPFGRG